MAQSEYIEASTKGKVGFVLLMLCFALIYFFLDIWNLLSPLPDVQPEYLEVRSFRELAGVVLATGLLGWLLYYTVHSAFLARRHMQFPAPSMNLPIRQKVQTIQKASTIWVCASIFFVSLAFQLIVMWYSWYTFHKLIEGVASGLT